MRKPTAWVDAAELSELSQWMRESLRRLLNIGKIKLNTLTITKTQLEEVLYNWIELYRNGKTRGQDETKAMSSEEVALESAEYLWQELQVKFGS
jgi:hypothetical protein